MVPKTTNKPTDRQDGRDTTNRGTNFGGFQKTTENSRKGFVSSFHHAKNKAAHSCVTAKLCATLLPTLKCLKQAKHVHMLATTGELGEVTIIIEAVYGDPWIRMH